MCSSWNRSGSSKASASTVPLIFLMDLFSRVLEVIVLDSVYSVPRYLHNVGRQVRYADSEDLMTTGEFLLCVEGFKYQ